MEQEKQVKQDIIEDLTAQKQQLIAKFSNLKSQISKVKAIIVQKDKDNFE